MLERASPFGRHTVDCANRFAIDQNDALVALAHIFQILLGNQRFAVEAFKHFKKRGEVLVTISKAEHARAAIAVKRLDDDIAELVAEVADCLVVPCDQGWRHQIGIFHDEDFFRCIAHRVRIIDHQRFRVNTLQQMGVGDIAHVERRILTQQDNIQR